MDASKAAAAQFKTDSLDDIKSGEMRHLVVVFDISARSATYALVPGIAAPDTRQGLPLSIP